MLPFFSPSHYLQFWPSLLLIFNPTLTSSCRNHLLFLLSSFFQAEETKHLSFSFIFPIVPLIFFFPSFLLCLYIPFLFRPLRSFSLRALNEILSKTKQRNQIPLSFTLPFHPSFNCILFLLLSSFAFALLIPVFPYPCFFSCVPSSELVLFKEIFAKTEQRHQIFREANWESGSDSGPQDEPCREVPSGAGPWRHPGPLCYWRIHTCPLPYLTTCAKLAASRPWSVWKGGGAELRGEGRKGVEGETDGMRQTERTEKPDKLIDKNETDRKKREQIEIYKNETDRKDREER